MRREVRGMMVALLASLWIGGCATGDIGEETSCTADEECAPGTCVIATGRCVSPPTPDAGNDTANDSANNTANNTVNNTANNSTDAGNNTTPDDGPATCTPACAANETCVDGSCVSACMPACESPAVCTPNGCAIPDCSQVGDACDPTRATQNGYVCADGGDGSGICLEPCSKEFEPSTCPSGFYCLDVRETAPAQLACIPSICDVDGDCGAGTCLNFENDFGFCLTAGNVAAGGACDVTRDDCVQGTYCRRTTSTGTSGTCTKLCDPFATGSCGPGAFCGPFVTGVEGLCSTNQSTLGTDISDLCSPAGSWCADHTQCVDLGTADVCMGFCRAGANDCAGVFDGEDGTCNNYLFPGDRYLGLCLPSCDPGDVDPCGPGAVCVDSGPDTGKCRVTCTPGTISADCCDGSTPCNFQCVNGLCE